MTPQAWDAIRRQAYREAGYRCGICGARGQLNCHERWAYDDDMHVQTLLGFIALCSLCHHVKHIGLAARRSVCVPPRLRCLPNCCARPCWLLDLGLPPQALIVAVHREGTTLIPRGSTVLEAGDVLTVVATPEALTRIEGAA